MLDRLFFLAATLENINAFIATFSSFLGILLVMIVLKHSSRTYIRLDYS